MVERNGFACCDLCKATCDPQRTQIFVTDTEGKDSPR